MKRQEFIDQSIELKIYTALERLSEAFRVLLLQQSKEIEASPMQLKILLFIFQHSESYCQPSYLANELNVTKATLSDSIKALNYKGWITKLENQNDSRSYTLALTDSGLKLMDKVEMYSSQLFNPIKGLEDQSKERLYSSLQAIITDLSNKNIISLERNCFKCRFYSKTTTGKHYCGLLEKTLAQKDLRLDCPEHESVL